MGLLAQARRGKKRAYARIEAWAERLPPAAFLAVLPGLFKVFHPRARLNDGVSMIRGDDGRWVVKDADMELVIPSCRRFSRYLCRGTQGVVSSVRRRYAPTEEILSAFSGGVVIDVGANIGEFTIGALQAGAAHCVAIEPDALVAECLRENLADHANRVTVIEALMDEKVGERDFFLASETADSSFIKPNRASRSVVMQASTIDATVSALDMQISVLKVEAEGAEPEVLRGAVQTLAKGNMLVTVDTSCERHGESTYGECAEILTRYGYAVTPYRNGMHLVATKRSV